MEAKLYHNLIGVPYSQMNCWQICQKFYKQVFNMELQNYFDPVFTEDKNYVNGLIRASEKDFKKVKSPSPGDLITIKLRGVECHIAIFLGNNLILHTSKSTGSVIDRLSRWHNMVVGYYTVEKDIK